MATSTLSKAPAPAAGKSSPPTILGLVDLLGLVEQFTSQTAMQQLAREVEHLSASSERRPDLVNTLRTMASVSQRIDAALRALEGAANVESPQNKVQSTFDDLLATGELLESAEFQKRAGWTRQALSRAVLAGRIFYLEVGGVRAYPAFYFDLRYNRKDVESVTKLLDDISGGSKWLFFTTPKGSLANANLLAAEGLGATKAKSRTKQLRAVNGFTTVPGVPRTPLRALEDGDVDLVKRSAKAYAER